jgi:hypothetical protein
MQLLLQQLLRVLHRRRLLLVLLLALLLLLRLLLPLRGRSRWVHMCVRQVHVCGVLMGVLAGAGREPCCCCGCGARHVFGDSSVAHAAADGVPCDEAAADGGAQVVCWR